MAIFGCNVAGAGAIGSLITFMRVCISLMHRIWWKIRTSFHRFAKMHRWESWKKKESLAPKRWRLENSIKNCNHRISIELIGIENQLGFFETLDTLKPSAKAMKSLVSEVWIMLCIPYYSDYYECDIYHQLATHCHQLMMKWTPS